jgi:hypothetical protein
MKTVRLLYDIEPANLPIVCWGVETPYRGAGRRRPLSTAIFILRKRSFLSLSFPLPF